MVITKFEKWKDELTNNETLKILCNYLDCDTINMALQEAYEDRQKKGMVKNATISR